MNMRDRNFIGDTGYYIWWLLNCSENLSKKQIIKEVTGIIIRLEKIIKKYPYLRFDLDELSSILEEIQSPDFDCALYKSYKENREAEEAELENFIKEIEEEQRKQEFEEYFDEEQLKQELEEYRIHKIHKIMNNN